jgi:hypothetical protein
MTRKTTTDRKPRTLARALAVLAVVLGAGLISAAPARADHRGGYHHGGFSFFFGLPFLPIPIPLPVPVYEPPRYYEPPVYYEEPPVYYEEPPVYYAPRAYYEERPRYERRGWRDDDRRWRDERGNWHRGGGRDREDE